MCLLSHLYWGQGLSMRPAAELNPASSKTTTEDTARNDRTEMNEDDRPVYVGGGYKVHTCTCRLINVSRLSNLRECQRPIYL